MANLRLSGSTSRAAAGGGAMRSSSLRLLALAITASVVVFFFFSLSFLSTSRTDSSDLDNLGFNSGSFGLGSTRRSVLALKSDPLKPGWTRSGSKPRITEP
ncbi:hypothetical protein M0R45_010305 [Rubus argutus]|uniref:Uncharacterized protein n=1 Tax=Rubus argutus TaxID=59490 RepID=A0AAW1Y6K8_RUBAR